MVIVLRSVRLPTTIVVYVAKSSVRYSRTLRGKRHPQDARVNREDFLINAVFDFVVSPMLLAEWFGKSWEALRLVSAPRKFPSDIFELRKAAGQSESSR